MATRRKSASRVQTETLDDQNPSNWTSSQLKAALSKIGIKITGNLSNSSLRRLYLDNQTKNSSATIDNSDNLAERNTVSDGNYSLNVSDATIRDPIDIHTSDRDVHPTPISTVQQEIATPSTSYAHAIPQLPPTAASAHATVNNNNQNVNMQNLLMNTIQLCQQSMQQMNKQGEQIQPSFNLSTALGHGSTSLGIAPSFNSTIPVYSTNSSTPGKFGFPASSFSAVDMVSPELRNDIITDEQVQTFSASSRSNSHSLPTAFRHSLDSSVETLWKYSVADSTRSHYTTGFDLYKKFSLLQGSFWTSNEMPPVSETLLMRFVAFCDEHKSLKYSTIKLYLCGIRYYYLQYAGFSPLEQYGKPLLCLQSILNGLKKKQKGCVKRPRLPITMSLLYKMVMLLRNNFFSLFNNVMLEAACVVAFFAFLRCGEFTILSNFDSETHLCVGDLAIFEDHILLHLKKSKTDPFRQGVTIPLYKSGHTICPCFAIKNYLSLRKKMSSITSDALFVSDDGNPLSRQFFIKHVKIILENLGLESKNYNGHSFRIGAATTAQEVRLEDHLIKTLGRWSSDCYTRYIHTSPKVIQQAQNQLVSSISLS
ncbi:uncharacterized protein [Mytilus edulis]|uniref:uncharacterized protein n=1 Tax=Mytilus edulis TaxID=6550 RepID=UPI0039EF3144